MYRDHLSIKTTWLAKSSFAVTLLMPTTSSIIYYYRCLQGAISKDSFPLDVIEAYKYTFSQPGALTPPINYYRCMFNTQKEVTTVDQEREGKPPKIDIPVLLIWVSAWALASCGSCMCILVVIIPQELPFLYVLCRDFSSRDLIYRVTSRASIVTST